MKKLVWLGLAATLGMANLASAGAFDAPRQDRERGNQDIIVLKSGDGEWRFPILEFAPPGELPPLSDLAELDYLRQLADLRLLQQEPAPPAPPEPPEPPTPPEPLQVEIFRAGSGSYLGIGVAEIDAERAKALNLKEERGVEVTRVSEGSPAAEAGLEKNDVVIEYNGTPVEGVEQFIRLVRETPVGRKVKLVVIRSGRPQTVTATIGSRKQLNREWEAEFRRNMDRLQESLRNQRFELEMPEIPRPFMAWPARRIGIEAEPLTPQLAEFFGVKKGVLVRSVGKGSAAEKAGIKAGDVITKVNGQDVDSPGEISASLRGIEVGKTVPVIVVRNRSEMTLQVAVEGRGENEFGGPGRVTRPGLPRAPRPVRPSRPVSVPQQQAL